VKGQTGAVTELREERTFRADTFVAIADVGVTFMVMRTADGQIVDADTVSATLVAAGKVGEVPAVKVVPTTTVAVKTPSGGSLAAVPGGIRGWLARRLGRVNQG
jgi:hypothetical protein